MSDATEIEISKDLLIGAAAIAEYIFGDSAQRRKIFYLVEKSRLPVFRFKSQICARKSTLLKWIELQESRYNKSNKADDE